MKIKSITLFMYIMTLTYYMSIWKETKNAREITQIIDTFISYVENWSVVCTFYANIKLYHQNQ